MGCLGGPAALGVHIRMVGIKEPNVFRGQGRFLYHDPNLYIATQSAFLTARQSKVVQRQTETPALDTLRAGGPKEFTAKAPPAASEEFIILLGCQVADNAIGQRGRFRRQIQTVIGRRGKALQLVNTARPMCRRRFQLSYL